MRAIGAVLEVASPDLAACANLFRANVKSVLFVTSQLRPRELKMADGLRRLGWKVGLIYSKWTPFDPKAYFDFCIEAASAEEAHAFAMQLSPRVTHVFSGAIDDWVLLLCRQKPSPVVIDLNDVFAPSLFDYCHERFALTQEALALADGFCARDLQVKSAERADKFKLPANVLLFPEYCWNVFPNVRKPSELTQPDDIHVVSVGTFSLETQGMYDSCYLRLTELLIEQQIHFHIYPHWAYRRGHSGSPHTNFERDFADFIALEKNSPYLHLHDSLPIEELAKVLPQYDFGIVSGGCAEFGQKLGFYYPAYLETCYSGRISDYLEARLPVLVNDEVKFDYWLLKRHGACVDLKGVLRPGFKQALLDLKRDRRQPEIMERAARKLSVDFNSPRLASYYEDIMHPKIRPIRQKSSTETQTPAVDPSAAIAERAAEMVALHNTASQAYAASSNLQRKAQFKEILHKKIRWASPRVAKILLPYRAIRLFEVRLHNTLQENQSTHASIASLQSQVSLLEQDKTALQAKVASFEQIELSLGQDRAALQSQMGSLEQEKAALHARIAALEQSESNLAQNRAILHSQVISLEQDKSALQDKVMSFEHSELSLGQDKAVLQVQVESLEQQNVVLRAKLTSLEQDKAALHTRVASLAQDKMALHTQIAALEQDKTALTHKLSSLEQSKTALEQGKAALFAKATSLEQDKRAARIQVAGLEDDKNALRAQITSLEKDKESFRAQVAGLEQDKDTLRGQVANLYGDKANLHTQISGLEQDKTLQRAQIVSLEQDKAVMQSQLSSLEQEKIAVLAQVAALEQDKTAMQSQLSNVEQEKIAVLTQVAALEQDKIAMQLQLANVEQEKTALQSQLSTLEQERTTLLAQVGTLEQDKAAVQSQLSNVEQEKTAALAQVAALEQDKTAMQLQLANVEQDKTALQSQLSSLEQEKLSALAQVAALEQDKVAIQLQLSNVEQEKTVVLAQVAALEQDKTAMQLQLANVEQEKSAALSQAATLEQDKAALQSQLSSLEQEKISVLSQAAALEQDKAAMQSLLTNLEQEKTSIQALVAGLEQDKVVYRSHIAGLEQEKLAVLAHAAALQQDQENQRAHISGIEQNNAVLNSQIEQLQQNNNSLSTRAKDLEGEIGALSQQVHVLNNEKFIRHQEAQWGKASIRAVADALNWPEVLNDVEQANGFTELARILGLFSGSGGITDNPSACWDALAAKNYDQLLNSGYNNFKRTIGNNYFNFLVQKGDPQIQAVERLLAPEVLERCRMTAQAVPHDPSSPSTDQVSYNYFVLLLWEYVKTIDLKRYSEVLEEPAEGNPILVTSLDGRKVSQDLANSLIEYYSISEAVSFGRIKTVLEIGGGYGRNAYTMLALNPKLKVTLVDIPPALYVAQRYLSSVFKDRRVFKARNFSRYAEVKEELEAASIVFLMPHQLALMPKKRFDLSMNISSLHEMGPEQIKWYFKQLNRLTGQYFYLKQWRTSSNFFDGVVLHQEDYPYPKSWRNVYSRPGRVQSEFFEAMYQVTS